MGSYKELKNLINVLSGEKESCVSFWLASQEMYSIFAKYDISVEYFKNVLSDGLFDSLVGVVKWDSSFTSTEGYGRFLTFANQKGIRCCDFVPLWGSLKCAISSVFYDSGLLSKKVQDELEKLFFHIFKESSEHLLSSNFDFGDIEERERQKNLRLLSEYKKAVDESNIVSKTTPKGVITYVNKQFCKISGYEEEELIGKSHNIIRHPDMPKETFREMWETIKSKKIWKGIVKNLKKDGETYIVDTTIVPIVDVDGDIVEFIGIRHDITELERTKEQLRLLNFSMKKKVNELFDMTQNLEQQATTDVLTGIFNRYKFDDVFEIELKKAKLQKSNLSLILFDIDHFKEINDSFGHSAGDSVLAEVARIVSHNIKRSDIFARWGGEEFAILVLDTDVNGAVSLAQKLRAAIEGHNFGFGDRVTASFGVCSFLDGDTPDSMFKKADSALYKAKSGGRNMVKVEF